MREPRRGDDTAEDDPATGEVVEVDVSLIEILVGGSPREIQVNQEHVLALSEAQDRLPPILVRRGSGHIIDGVHRYLAARKRGCRTIAVRYYDGDDESAFVLGVETNVRHGLPLTLAERKAAARRIIRVRPEWSDRAIAVKVGLDHKTVGTIRARLGGEIPHPKQRIGRDGRRQRVRATAVTDRGADADLGTGEVEPDGESKSADGDESVRAADQGDPEVVPQPRSQARARSGRPRVRGRGDGSRPALSVEVLSADPSLRYSQSGRFILRMLESSRALTTRQSTLVDALPDHCLRAVAEAVEELAFDLQAFADILRNRHKRRLRAASRSSRA